MVTVGLATIVGLLGLSVALFFNPVWVSFEQGRADAAAWTGFAPGDLRAATDAILGDLYTGNGDFMVTVEGVPVLDPRERAHMRDVRSAFVAFGGLVAIAAAVLVGAALVGRRRPAYWRGIRAGATVLVAAVVVLGVVALVAFDALFEIFHRLLFAGGSYTFDPRTERLVQLFPDAFWFETSVALSIALIVLGLAVRTIAGRRLSALR